jgi:hypothetical protein
MQHKQLELANKGMMHPESIKRLALKYLLQSVGQVLTRQQIEEYVRVERGTAYAGEVTRRIRDLRREGWQIQTNKDGVGLRPGQYLLVTSTKGEQLGPSDRRTLDSLIEEISNRPEKDRLEILQVLRLQFEP